MNHLWCIYLVVFLIALSVRAESRGALALSREGETITTARCSAPRSAGHLNQPDYSCWQQASVGMSSNDIVALLGSPFDIKSAGPFHVWDYGEVVPVSTETPLRYAFDIVFVGTNVSSVTDPFGGIFSTNGIPTAPQLVIPLDGSVFNHTPRIVDFRWQPSSGVYPLTYEIEVRAGYHGEVEGPCLTSFVTRDGTHTWRVRAVNALGKGPWSSTFHFSFTE